jgi:parvulin-like peptidyl-prolyl isomerase
MAMATINQDVPAATWGESAVPVHALLANLHRDRRLLPLLREAVVEQFLLDQAAAAGLTVSTEELQQAADLFRRRHGLISAERTQAWLAQEHWSATNLEDALEHDLLIAKFKEHLFKDRLAAHFEANRSRYDQVVLRAIVVGEEDLAKELLIQLRDEGRDFAGLAGEHSQHASRWQGGLLGSLRRQQLADAVAAAVFAARPGDVVGPLQTASGFELLLVESFQPAQLDGPTAALIRQQWFDGWLAAKLRETPLTLPLLDAL